MRYPIKILEQVQRIDLEIGAVEGEGSVVRSAMKKAQELLEGAKRLHEALGAELEAINVQRSEIQVHLDETNAKVKKATDRIGEVKNDRELKALTREKSQGAKTAKNIEAELRAVQAAFDGKQSEVEVKAVEVEAGEQELERLSGELTAGKEGWDKAVEEKMKLRDELVRDIPESLLKKYEAIKASRGGRAVVHVKNEACQGCFIHVPPQLYVQLMRGEDELISCPHCYRILYVEDQPATV